MPTKTTRVDRNNTHRPKQHELTETTQVDRNNTGIVCCFAEIVLSRQRTLRLARESAVPIAPSFRADSPVRGSARVLEEVAPEPKPKPKLTLALSSLVPARTFNHQVADWVDPGPRSECMAKQRM